MKKIIFVAIWLFLSTVTSEAYGVVLQNPGFESWTENLPDGWTVSKNATNSNYNTYEVGPSSYHYDNEKSVEIILEADAIGIYDSNTYLYQQLTGSEVDQAYSFSFWYYVFGGCGGSASVGVGIATGIDPYGGNDPFSSDVIWTDNGVPGDPHWYSKSIEAVARNTQLTVFIKSRNSGSIWYSSPRGGYPGAFTALSYIDAAEIKVVPEPSSFLLLASGLFVLIYMYMHGTQRGTQRGYSLWEFKVE